MEVVGIGEAMNRYDKNIFEMGRALRSWNPVKRKRARDYFVTLGYLSAMVARTADEEGELRNIVFALQEHILKQ